MESVGHLRDTALLFMGEKFGFLGFVCRQPVKAVGAYLGGKPTPNLFLANTPQDRCVLVPWEPLLLLDFTVPKTLNWLFCYCYGGMRRVDAVYLLKFRSLKYTFRILGHY